MRGTTIKILTISIIAIYIANNAYGQSKKAEAFMKSAQTAFNNRDYDEALRYTDKAISADDSFAEAWLMRGEIGTIKHNDDIAADGYEHCLAIDSGFFPPAAVALSKIYNNMMRYDDALKLILWYKNSNYKKNNIADIDRLADQYAFRSKAVKTPVGFVPKNLGKAINTEGDEYINMILFNGKSLIFTRREAYQTGGERLKEGLWIADSKDSQWETARPFRLNWEYNDNMGAAFISADGNDLLFTLCGINPKTGCDICGSTAENNGWGLPAPLNDNINSSSWDSQPCLSANGKELYFVSRRSGNADIYVSHRNDNGTWEKAVPLNEKINTTGNEMAPMLHPDGQTLYFSSDGHIGMGGFDIFVSRRDNDGNWQEPTNIGFPINTPDDEINFIVAADSKTAYISSSCIDGYGKYDIFSFTLDEAYRPSPVTFINISVCDKTTNQKIPAFVKFYNPNTGKELLSFSSTSGDILAVMPSMETYDYTIESDGFMFVQESIAPDRETTEIEPFELSVCLDKLVKGASVTLHNIQFDFDKYELTDESNAGISMIADFLTRHPDIIIELAGHTDNIGDSRHNMELSKKRAETVRDALITKGINPQRMTAKGYDSSRPLVSNDSEANRHINRRTEMIIK